LDPRHPNRHFILGIIVLFVGLVLLLDQLGFGEASKIFLFWPLILIYFGVQKLVSSSSMVGRFWGGFLALLGISFQLEALGLTGIRFGTIWPVFLICAGVLLVLRRYESRNTPPYYPPPPPPPGPEPPSAPSTEPSAAGSTPPPPGADAAGTGAASEAPSASPPPPQSAPHWQAPPEAQPRSQSPPQPNFPGWDPGNWRHQRAWDRFEREMNRLSDQINNRRGPQSNWVPNSGQQSNPNWQSSRPNWQTNSHWHESSQPRLDEVNIFWGGRKRIVSKNFLGGEIVSIFGGFEIDLTQADFTSDQIQIEIVSIFGGGELQIPTNWEVMVESVGIFGGTGDRTWHPNSAPGVAAPATPAKRLIIKGVSIFGGLTIKN